MRFGIHLPQYGRAAGPTAIAAAARQAEALGFDDIWVYDHVAVPVATQYPAAFSFEPIVTLSYAAAVTERIGLGTSVLVLPYRHPVFLAKALGSLDVLSGGRLTLGVGVGWLEPEFDALDVSFSDRGRLTDEAIDVLRATWDDNQPVTFSGPTVEFAEMRILPSPERRVPIWVGGQAPPALRRAVERGDGWHGAFVPLDQVAGIAAHLRAERPESAFTLSMRLELDASLPGPDEITAALDTLAAAGIQHVMAAPAERTLDGWLAAVERFSEVAEPYCRDRDPD